MNTESETPRVWQGIRRGVLGRCPHCGQGSLFLSYLKVVTRCSFCALGLEEYRADDGPAHLTILIVGHIFIAPLLFSEFIRTWPTWQVLAIMIPGMIMLSLVLLPRVKGAFVGLQWAVGDRYKRLD